MAGTEPRDVVRAFAIEMERQLQANDHKGGWGDEDRHWLLERLREEVAELTAAIKERTPSAIVQEAADVANFAMMIADVSCASGLTTGETPLSAQVAALRATLDRHGVRQSRKGCGNHQWVNQFYEDCTDCEKVVTADPVRDALRNTKEAAEEHDKAKYEEGFDAGLRHAMSLINKAFDKKLRSP